MKSIRAAWRALGLVLACLITVSAVTASAAGELDVFPPADAHAQPDDEAPAGPRKVVIGAYINDIQEVDFRTHSYAVDLYVWLRWPESALDASQSLEFMNRVAPSDHTRELLYDKPKVMPDGSLYTVIRTQGRFSNKFALEKYPFDTQTLTVEIEDNVSSIADMAYVPDKNSVTANADIVLPGFKVGPPLLRVETKTYPTDFGDLVEPGAPSYSRVTIGIPISRPVVTLSAKTFVPILLIMICAALVFFVRPGAVEGRIGLAITSLLTLVALQLTSGSALPDVDYLTMLDKVYFLSYVFVFAVLVRAAATSWVEERTAGEDAVARGDRRWAMALTLLYVGAVSGVVVLTILPRV